MSRAKGSKCMKYDAIALGALSVRVAPIAWSRVFFTVLLPLKIGKRKCSDIYVYYKYKSIVGHKKTTAKATKKY